MKLIAIPATLLFLASAAFSQAGARGFDFAAEGVRIEPDKRLIVVLASLEAAGLQTPLTKEGEDLRKRLASDFQGLDKDLVAKMQFFITQYKKRHTGKSEAELIAPFISMAYTLSPAPELAEPTREVDLPGDLLEVLDFSPLIRQFYRSAVRTADGTSTVGQRIDSYFGEYRKAGDLLRPSAAVMIRDVVDYLNTRPQLTVIEQKKVEVKGAKGKGSVSRVETRERERRFFIVPEMLAPAGTVNFRNIGDDYFAIVPTGIDVSDSEVRKAYLQFVLDPLVLKNARELIEKREGVRALLDERRKSDPEVPTDVVLAAARSLVVAADIRERAYRRMQEAVTEARRNPGRKPISETTDQQGRKVVQITEDLYLIDGKFAMPAADDDAALQLSDAYEKGAVLAFYFAEQLKGIEESGFDIASSLKDMIISLDPAKEADRLAENAMAKRRATAERESRRKTVSTVLENPVTKRLIEIEPMIQSQNFGGAETELKTLLESNSGDARIYYALGRVKSLSAAAITDIEKRNVLLREAKGFFDEVLRMPDDRAEPALKSLTYVKTAQIFEYYDQNEYAIKVYEAAIKIGDVPGGAYGEAVASRERLIKKQ